MLTLEGIMITIYLSRRLEWRGAPPACAQDNNYPIIHVSFIGITAILHHETIGYSQFRSISSETR